MAAAPHASGSDLGRLKDLLFKPEQAKIDALQRQCDAFAAKIGDDARFEASIAEVIAGALRKAEVTRGREVSGAIAPLVVAAIRSEIVNSRDMMVDALYPITGRLVAAAVANAFRELADSLDKRIDALLSTELWKLRLRALISRRPLSDVLLDAARRPQVARLLVLERDTGKLLASWRADGRADESVELVSGLIAAISQFSAQAFAREHGELRELDLGASHVLLRASARMLVAAEFSGLPDAADGRRMDAALIELIERPTPLDESALARLAQHCSPGPAARSPASRRIFYGLLAAALCAALYLPVRDAIRDRRIEAAFAQAATAQNLDAWPLRLAIDHRAGAIWIRGLAPEDADLDALAGVLAPAAPYRVELRVARIGGDGRVAARLDALRAELSADGRVVAARLQKAEAALAEGEAWRADRDAREKDPAAVLARLAGASVIRFADEVRLKEPERAQALVARLAEALKASGASLRVVGYTDSTGSLAKNHAISAARASLVVKMLVEAGVAPEQLVAVGRGDQTPILDDGGEARVGNRRVAFELPAGEGG